jgi:hypothetical protein
MMPDGSFPTYGAADPMARKMPLRDPASFDHPPQFWPGQECVLKGTRLFGIIKSIDAKGYATLAMVSGDTRTVALKGIDLPPQRAPRPEVKRTPPKAPLKFLSYSEMINLPDPQWLIEGVIMEETSALMFGKSNSFKSFLAIDMACSVATGHYQGDWHGHKIVDGWPVLYVATEGALGVAKQRIPGWMQAHGIPEDMRSGIALYPQEIALDDDNAVNDLLRSCAINSAIREETTDWNNPSFAFKMVVIDIFGASMMGPETSDETARAWVRNINRIKREMRCAVLTVAHTGWADETRARMHTHFWGSFDTRMKAEGDKDSRTTVLTIDRHKDADSTGEWGFRLEVVDTPTGGTTLVPRLEGGVKIEKRKRISGKTLVAMQALDEALAENGRRVTSPNLPSCNVVEIEKWRAMCDRHGLTDSDDSDTQARTFRRHRDALMAKDLIRQFDGFVWKADQ